MERYLTMLSEMKSHSIHGCTFFNWLMYIFILSGRCIQERRNRKVSKARKSCKVKPLQSEKSLKKRAVRTRKEHFLLRPGHKSFVPFLFWHKIWKGFFSSRFPRFVYSSGIKKIPSVLPECWSHSQFSPRLRSKLYVCSEVGKGWDSPYFRLL